MNKEDAYTIKDLPAHVARSLSAEQRQALEPLRIQRDVPGKGFVTLEVPEGGSYVLYPERMNGDDPMCEIKSRLGSMSMEEAFKVGKLEDREAEARRWQVISGADFGAVWSQRLAIELLTALRERPLELMVETQLTEGGFTQTEEGGNIWRKTGKGGFYTFFNKEESGWLTFEKNSATHWHNLLLMNYHHVWQDEIHAHPIFWPDTVADPRRAVAGLAVLASELWTPELLPQRGRKRKP